MFINFDFFETSKISLPFGKNWSTGRLKPCSTVQSNFVRENIFSMKCSFQGFFRIMSEDNSNYWRKIFNMVPITAFYVSRGRLWFIICFLENFFIFFSSRTWAPSKNFSAFWQFFSAGFQKSILRVEGDLFEGEKNFLKVLLFMFFGHWAKKCWLLTTVFRQGSENFFFVSGRAHLRSFLEELCFFLYFSDIERKHFGLFSKFS